MAVPKIEIFSYASVVSLSYYETELSKDNPFRFKYMSLQQREAVRLRLINTLVAMRMDAQNHMERGRKLKMKQRCDDLQKCCDLLYTLDHLDDSIALNAGRECPLGYLGLYAHLDLLKPKTDPNDPKQVQRLVGDIQDFVHQVKTLDDPMNDNTDEARQALGKFNDLRRLHWFAGVSIAHAVSAFVLEEAHYRGEYQSQFDDASSTLSTPMGFVAVFLYFIRIFTVELKEAIQQARSRWQPVKSKGVSLPDEGAWARFKADMGGMRKYLILNDLYWGMVNTLCFFWLRSSTDVAVNTIFGLEGSPTLGLAGNILTLAFLVMDIILVFARFMELKHKFEAEAATLDKKIEAFDTEALAIQQRLEATLDAADAAALKSQLKYLEATKRQAQEALVRLRFNWKYQKYQLWAELGYTSSLVFAFGMMSAFVFTGATFSGLLLAVVGAAAWFVLTLVYNGVNAAIEHTKMQATIKERQIHAESLLEEFNDPKTSLDKRGLYLQIKELLSKNDLERRQAAFLWKKIGVQSFTHALVPAVLFCATVFMPWGWGVLLLGVFVVLLYAGKKILDSWEPKKNEVRFFPSFEAKHPFHLNFEKQFNSMMVRQGAGVILTFKDFEETKPSHLAPDSTEETSILSPVSQFSTKNV